MDIRKKGTKTVIRIHPGELYVSRSDVIITTILGSCVSACMYDPVNKIIGMNHFLLSNKRYAKHIPVCQSEAGRYGIHAMELLINKMLQQGARRENLHAKAFGGGSILQQSQGSDNFLCVGDVNSRFILEFIKLENIKLQASDLGGNTGRVVHFHFDDYSVYSKKINNSINRDLVRKEKRYWQKSINKQAQETAEVELWG